MAGAKRRAVRRVKGGQRRQPSARETRKIERRGADVVAVDVVDEVVGTLVQLARRANMELTLQVGEVVVNRIYGGLKALRERGPRDASFRRLAAHPRLPFSAVTLWRSVAIYELVQRLPGFAKAKHLGVAHLRAALGLPERVQEQLLRAAEVERWTKERLEERAAKYREKGEGRRGRRPMLPALRCVHQLDRLTSKETSVVGGLDLAELDEAHVHDLEQRLERIRTWCVALEGALAVRRAGKGGASLSPSGPPKAVGGEGVAAQVEPGGERVTH